MIHRDVEIVYHGPAATHNVKCWLCGDKPAIYNMNPVWRFEPCWSCQKVLNETKSWRTKILEKIMYSMR